ncbi:MAG TPA: hypothetical protein VLY45_07880 [Nitrospiria bacterium]|nr:hypothetical protein [Nitrospiria bacterium]
MAEGDSAHLFDTVARLRAEIDALRRDLTALNDAVSTLRNRYTATCTQCGTAYDLLANHYSVGLFDNVVYVKCPKCQKAVPIEGLQEGGIRLISD